MKVKVFLFLFLILSLSFSYKELLFPKDIVKFFEVGDNLLGVIYKDSFAVYSVSSLDYNKLTELTSRNLKVLDIKKVGNLYFANVVGGFYVFSDKFEEIKFVKDFNLLDVVKVGDLFYLLTSQGVYSFKLTDEKPFLVFSLSPPTSKGYLLYNSGYLYAFGDKTITKFSIINDEIEAEISYFPIATPPVNFNSKVFLGDIYGNVYYINNNSLKNVLRLGFPIMGLGEYGGNLVAITPKNIVIWNDNIIKELTYYEPFITRVIFSDFITIVGRKTFYVFDGSSLVENEVETKIVDGYKINDKHILFLEDKRLLSFSNSEVTSGCMFKEPFDYFIIGYMDVPIKLLSTHPISSLTVNGELKKGVEKEGNEYVFVLNPRDYEFGNIILKCDNAKLTLVRDENGPIGVFIIDIPSRIKEGERIEGTPINQFGKPVGTFSLFVDNKKVGEFDSLNLTLPPGDHTLLFVKDGYVELSKTVKVEEDPLSFILKVLIVILFSFGLVYLTLIRTGILERKIEEIRLRLKKME